MRDIRELPLHEALERFERWNTECQAVQRDLAGGHDTASDLVWGQLLELSDRFKERHDHLERAIVDVGGAQQDLVAEISALLAGRLDDVVRMKAQTVIALHGVPEELAEVRGRYRALHVAVEALSERLERP